MRLPMYEVRGTRYDLKNSASGTREAAKQVQGAYLKAVHGRN